MASVVITVASGSSAAQVQTAIDDAPAGATVRLAAGTYTFNQSVVIDRDDITVQGAGSGKTVITLSASVGDAPAFQIGAPQFQEQISAGGTLAAASQGSTRVKMTGGDAPQAGDVVWISADNDAGFLNSIGDVLWRQDKPLRTIMAVVTGVSGSTVTLDRDLPMDFPAGSHIQVIETADNVTLSGMTLKGAYGTANPADFTNTKPAGDDATMVLANGTTDLRLSDIEIIQPVSNGVIVAKSIDPVVAGLKVTGAHNKGDGGNGYGIEIRDVYDGRFSGLTIIDTRHAVVFASYTSANGNVVEVDLTNRDINFHGGLDTGNTVRVLESLRTTVAEQGYLGSVTFFNPGTTYGAPTDPATNLITFGEVIGTVRADEVRAMDSGARIETLGGNDTLWGGAGNDWLDGGTGNDTFHFSGGRDTLTGGFASDVLVVDAAAYGYVLRQTTSEATVTSFFGTTTLRGIETVQFSTSSVAVTSVANAGPVKTGTASYDAISSATSVIAGSGFDAVTFTGSKSVYFLGNNLSNRATGNSGHNLLLMGAGDDVAHGNSGNDSLSGGDGDDFLTGGNGRDLLRGDAGSDTLRGDAGADTYYASEGQDFIVGFSKPEGDSFVFAGHTTAEALDAVEIWSADHGVNLDGFSITTVSYDGIASLMITSDEGDSLVFVNMTADSLLAAYDWG